MKNSNVRWMLLAVMCITIFDVQAAWYRGNTHTHTYLSGHGDWMPGQVAKWFYDHNYDFLCLSEHNKFIDPDTVKMPAGAGNKFLLVPSEEVTASPIPIHTTGFNISKKVDPSAIKKNRSQLIQSEVDGIRAVGGVPILNHPNWGYPFAKNVDYDEIYKVKSLNLFELFNVNKTFIENPGDSSQ